MARHSLRQSCVTPYEIRLAPSGEVGFASLDHPERRALVSVVQGLAELAALAPIQVPTWLRGPRIRPPLIEMEVAGHLLSYELDPAQRALRVVGLKRAARAAEAFDRFSGGERLRLVANG